MAKYNGKKHPDQSVRCHDRRSKGQAALSLNKLYSSYEYRVSFFEGLDQQMTPVTKILRLRRGPFHSPETKLPLGALTVEPL
jgi:hypothetical protein